jgi:hypothetical protein
MVDVTGSAETAPRPDGARDASGCGADGGGTDGGGILCNGACVDPASDPHNCNGCGNTCASGRCGTSIVATMGSAPTAWSFNGSASYSAATPSAELTPIGNALSGSLVYADPVVVDAFDAQFDFRMGVGGGSRSDGMGFALLQDGPKVVGLTGGGLGMSGLAGYGVELDIWNNATCGDVSADHVGVDALSVCSPTEGTPTSLVSQDVTGVVDLADAQWHTAQITLANGAIGVTVDGHAIVKGQALPNLSPGAAYYFGFTAGTGGLRAADGGPGGYRQEVKNVTITFPTPRCL